MPNKLSYSAMELYKECGRAFDLRYNQKVVSLNRSSALYFGSAVDDALNSMLLEKHKDGSKNKPEDVFLKNWTSQIGPENKFINLKNSADILFFKGDFNKDLFDPSDLKGVSAEEAAALFLDVYDRKKTEKIQESELKKFNRIAWSCLKNKGLLLLEEYRKTMLPLVEETIEVQKYVSLKNKEGDVVRGYVDGVVRINGKVVCLDNKTSSTAYGKDSVKTSRQLGLYQLILNNEGYGIEQCAYFVLHKRLLAKNKVKTEIVIDTIEEGVLISVLNDLSGVNHQVKLGIFEPNFNSC